jgi:hypothetical protein
LYLAPSEQAESFTLASLDKPRDERTGMTFQMHVVGERGEFVELAKAPEVRGTLMVTFTIGEDGHVGQVTTTGLDAAGACVTDVLHKAAFPKPSGLVQVEYPLYFKYL